MKRLTSGSALVAVACCSIFALTLSACSVTVNTGNIEANQEFGGSSDGPDGNPSNSWITTLEPVSCFPREDGASKKLCDLSFTLENNTTYGEYADGWVWAKLSNGETIRQEEGSFSRYYVVEAGDSYRGKIFFWLPVGVTVIEIYKSYLKDSDRYWTIPVNTTISSA